MRSLSTSLVICLTVGRTYVVRAFLWSSHRVLPPSFIGFDTPLSPRFAIVYGADGELSTEEEDQADVPDSVSTPLPPDVVNNLTSQLSLPLLVRLGCAFAPPPHTNTLHPKNAESATLVSIDSTKLEIAVATPVDGGLVQILVPVIFPTPCDESEDMESCLMDNIQKLDAQAEDRIGDFERTQDNHEELADQQRIAQKLQEEPYGDELPEWWTFPELKIFLEEKCKSMKGLLNDDDFAVDLQALCQARRSSVGKIVQASVAKVGPSGLFLRARLQKLEDDGATQYTIEDIAIPFAKEVPTEDSLRTAVLDLIESVAPGPVDESPVDVFVPDPISADLVTKAEEIPDLPTVAASTETEEEEEKIIRNTAKAAEEVGAPEMSDDATVAFESSELESSTDKAAGEEDELLSPKEHPTPEDIAKARKQPKARQHEAELAMKYAAIEDVGERAFAILKDLYMI